MATTLTDPKTGRAMPFSSENAADYKVALASGYVPTPGVLATQVGNAGVQKQNIQTATYNDKGQLVSQTGSGNPASYISGTTQKGGLTSWQDVSQSAGDNNVSSHYDATLGTWVAGPDPNSKNTMTGVGFKNTALDPKTGISTQTGSGQLPTFEWTPGNKETLSPELIAKAIAATKSGDTSGYWQTVLGQAQHYGMIDMNQAFSANPATYTPGMISSETARNSASGLSSNLNQMDGEAASVFMQQQKMLQDRYNEDAAALQRKNDAEQISTMRSQAQDKATMEAAQFKTGRTGTLYGAAELAQMGEAHRQELQAINNKYLDLTTQARRALEDGNVALAKEYRAAAATEIKNAKDAQAAFDTHQKNLLDINKQATEQADSTIDNILNAGIKPDASMLSALDKKFGLDSGSSALLYASADSIKKITDAKTATEAQNLAVDGAKKLQDYLDSRPMGEPVNIAGVTYIGTGKGDIKKGLEIDKKTGRGVYYEFNPADPTHPTIMDAGQMQSPADGNWTIEKADDGSLWRVNADTKQMEKLGAGGVKNVSSGLRVPLEPGEAQKTFNKLLPEGSTPPCRPGGEAYQGQCASYTNWAYGAGIFGSTIQQKTAKLEEYGKVDPQEIRTNMTFVQKAGTTGHVGLVGDVVRDPKTGAITGFYANESNMVPPYGEKVSYSRFVKIDDAKLVGFADIPTPNLPAIGGDSKVANDVNAEPTFGGKKEEILSPADLKAYGLDPSNPRYANLTRSGLQKALEGNVQAPETIAPGTTMSGKIERYADGYTTKMIPGAKATQAEIDQDAMKYALTGSLPSLGMGASVKRDMILNRAAQLADSAGTSLDILRADYKANQGSLNQQIKLKNSVDQFERTAQKNLDVALEAMKGVGNDGVPYWQKYKQSLQTGAVGDPKVAAFQTALKTVALEYAKIMSGSTSASGATVSSQEEALKMLNSYMTKGQINAISDIMKQDMKNRKDAIDETISGISGSIGDFYKNSVASEEEDPGAKAAFQRKYETAKGMSISPDILDEKWQQYLASKNQ